MHFVTITDSSFMPGLNNDGDTKQCNIVFAKWVVDNSYGYYSDTDGLEQPVPWDNQVDVQPARFDNGLVVDSAADEILINFTAPISVTDETGMEVAIDAGTGTINSVSAVGDLLTITLAAAVTAGQVVKFSYDSGTGNLAATGEGTPAVGDITDAPVVNEV